MRDVANLIHRDLYKNDRKIKAFDLNTDLRSRSLFGGSKGKGRGALRRMTSRYWRGNSSIFALDIVGAVMRQGTFIMKMQQLDWLNLQLPTSLSGFMHICIQKYNVFWSIIVNNPSQMAVPTLDVDLVWHTHQLAPKSYYSYSLETTKAKKPARFIDHNDHIDEGRLSDSFEWAVKQYQKLTKGMVYNECFCWYCEATRGEGLLAKLSLWSNTHENLEKVRQGEVDISTEATHISAHNTVRFKGEVAPWRRKKIEKLINRHRPPVQRETVQYSREKVIWNEESNNREHASILEPFAPDPPLHRDVYINNPNCFSATRRTGDCVAGSCTPSMAAGSCGGSSFSAACATGQRYHGHGFTFVQGSVGGPGGGIGCGEGGC